MRCTSRLIAAGIAVAAATCLAGCGSSSTSSTASEGSGASSISRRLAAVEAAPAENVSRTETFETLDELQGASELVVVARAGEAREHATGASKTDRPLSFLDVAFSVDQVLMGKAGTTVTVFAEGPSKFKAGQTYLLFLRPLVDGQDTYAVTGYMAGMYQEVALPGSEEAFGRVDPESPALPQGLELTGASVDSLIALK